jgi:hypothetical protein
LETKHAIFFIFLFLGVPFLTLLWYSSKQAQKIGAFLLILSIPFNEVAGINFFTDPSYRGTSRGFEVTLTDLIATSILFFLYIKNKKIILFPKGSVFYIIYLMISFISILNSESRVHSGWELQKMLLMYLFFLTLYNYIVFSKNIDIILKSLCFLIIINFIIILNQKYITGYYQPSGLFAHRNSTSMFINLIAPIFLSLLLNLKIKNLSFYYYLIIYALCTITVIFALSRGAIFFFPIAAAIVASFSIASKVTNRKIQVIALFLVLAILGTLKSAPMVVERFERASERSGETRVRLAKIAVRMANDKFFGIGLNNWGIKVNPPFTYSEGLRSLEDEEYKDGIVETTYLLVAAECGWIGFTSLLFWFGYYLFQNVFNIRRYKNTLSEYLPIGILAGLIAVFGQSTLEWVLKQRPNFYELMLIFAIIAAMAKLYENHKKITQL